MATPLLTLAESLMCAVEAQAWLKRRNVLVSFYARSCVLTDFQLFKLYILYVVYVMLS